MSTFFHGAAFHGILVALAGALMVALTAIVDAIHSGAIPIPASYAIFGTLGAAILTAAGVALRNYIEAQSSTPVQIAPTLPIKAAPPVVSTQP